MRKHRLLGFAAIAACQVTLAQSEPPPALEGSVELGAVATTGNTETLSVQSKADFRHTLEDWQNQYVASVLFKEDQVTRDDGTESTERTAERYYLSAKSGYKLNQEHSTIFLFGSHTIDEFGAFEEYTTASIGYGTRFVDRSDMWLDAEIGPGYFRGERVAEDDTIVIEKGFMVRGAAEFKWQFSDSAEFIQSLSVESGSDNTRTIAETAVITSVNESLQMKVGYSVYHNSEVAPDREATDTTTSVNLVYNL